MISPFPIWPGQTPGALGSAEHDVPTLTPYLAPARADGSPAPTFLVLPGGGYGALAEHEGKGYAEWFAAHGISAFVLQYRLGSHGYRHPAMLHDAARAMRLLRAKAGEFGIDPGRIGIIGSSAGGHLAATLLTQFDAGDASATDPAERLSSRPDVGILCYPVITLTEPFTHRGSRDNLLGADAPEELRLAMSAERNVTAATPPTFIWHTLEDQAVPVENVFLFASALRRQGVPFALHIYEPGRHGLGLGQTEWGPTALRWLGLRWPEVSV